MKKYGRTYHLPISEGVMSDDKIITTLADLIHAQEVVITEKTDGENTTIHATGCHARSPDSRYHPSRDWMKAFAASISPQLAPDERIVGEYLYARHSVSYDNLPSYFLGFAWILKVQFQGWDATLERFQSLGIAPVRTLARGKYSENLLSTVVDDLNLETQEGFVVRTTAPFSENDMPTHIAKYVRKDHVQPDTHWMHSEIVKNTLG